MRRCRTSSFFNTVGFGEHRKVKEHSYAVTLEPQSVSRISKVSRNKKLLGNNNLSCSLIRSGSHEPQAQMLFHVTQESVESNHTANRDKFIQVHKFTRRFRTVRPCARAQVTRCLINRELETLPNDNSSHSPACTLKSV